MASPAIVQGLGKAKHEVNQFVRTAIYFPGKTDLGEPVSGELTVDLHLVDDLKANILLGMDVVGPKTSISLPLKRTSILVAVV